MMWQLLWCFEFISLRRFLFKWSIFELKKMCDTLVCLINYCIFLFFLKIKINGDLGVTPDNTIRALNWQFPETSISPILSHFHNNLHLDSKLVMMSNHQPPCCSFPCFPLHQVAPQFYTLRLQPLECIPPFWRSLCPNYSRNFR